MTGLTLLCAALVGAGCKSSAAPAQMDAASARPSEPSLVALRPYALHVPSGRSEPLPLVIVLHGYGGNAADHARYFGFERLAEEKGFVVASPDGTPDARGNRFWNATDACCNFAGAKVDDVAYIAAVIDDAASRARIDRKRVYVVGHSNGGFMALRLACELAPRIAAVASLAGAGWKDAKACKPSEAVGVLQIHGDKDSLIAIGGGRVALDSRAGEYPSARDTLAPWAERNGCTAARGAAVEPLDLDLRASGAETAVDRYAGCSRGVELWTMRGVGHSPALAPRFAEAVWDFFSRQAKP